MKRSLSLLSRMAGTLAGWSLLLLLTGLVLPAAGASVQCTPSPPGLVSWWRAEGDGSDRVGANHGAVGGGLGFTAGQVGQAFNFTGAGQQVVVPASASLHVGIGSGFTIEAWVYPSQTNSQMPIAEWGDSLGTGTHFWLNVSFGMVGGPGALYAATRFGDSSFFASPPGMVVPNVWQHVAFTYDMASGVERLYLNGVEVAAKNIGSVTGHTDFPLNLGRRFGGDTFQGRLDEVSLYQRALSAAELQAIYNAGAAGKCLPAPPNGPGMALSFDGADDYLSAAPAGLPVANSAYTIEAWIRPDLMHVGAVAAWGDYAPNQVNAFVLDVDGLVNYWWGNDLKLLTTNLAGAWHHVAVTFDGTTRRILLDGLVLTNDTPLGHAASASNFRIGRANLGQYFDGFMDEVRIWSVARTPAQVQADMRRQVTNGLPGLVAYYRLDEGSGVIAQDSSGAVGGSAASFVNGPTWTASTILPFAPAITTFPASPSPTHALFQSVVNPNGNSTVVTYEWGLTTGYGSNDFGLPRSLGNGTSSIPTAVTHIGLRPGTTYHYRAVAVNGHGASFGADEVFTTPRVSSSVVSNLNDSGLGSLRQAIAETAPGGTVTFAVSSGTSVLTSPLVITQDLVIVGPGAQALTLSGNQATPVFSITAGGVRISGLSIASGRATGANGANGATGAGGPGGTGAGGGILNLGDLTLTDCMLINNVAEGGTGGLGGISGFDGLAGGTGGTALGAAICNSNRLTLLHCTFFTNHCLGGMGGMGRNVSGQFGGTGGNGGAGGPARGGAIFNAGWLVATNCTFFANTAGGGSGGTGGQGGDDAGGRGGDGVNGGGGAIVDGGTLALVNCTIAGNSAFGGAGGSGGTGFPNGANGANSTGSHGGLRQTGMAGENFLRNTIVANNTAASARDLAGSYVSGGFNLLGVTGDGQAVTGFTNATDQVGTLGVPVNPQFGVFGNYGGTALVLPLLTNSPALDKGHSSGVLRDQRGFLRPVDAPQAASAAGGDGADIGAFELHRGALYLVTNTLPGNVPGSLWWAISNANINAISSANTIGFNIPGPGPHTIRPTTALPSIRSPVTIDGYTQPGAWPNTLAVGSDAVLKIELNGEMAGTVLGGLMIQASNCIVRGLVINSYHRAMMLTGNNIVIAGNFIGLDVTGTQARPNLFGILGFYLSNSLIGGTTPGDRNIISGNTSWGLNIPSVAGNRYQGNYIGTDAAGTTALGQGTGIVLSKGPLLGDGNLVGGVTPGTGNLISGNIVGIHAFGSSNVIQGNLMGVNAAGTCCLSNIHFGVLIEGGTNLVGGASAASRNLISGSGVGVGIGGSSVTSDNRIEGNTITSNLVGVKVFGVDPIPWNNAISANSIFNNAGLGIDLDLEPFSGTFGLGVVTPNDADDADEGPNHLQNFPVITNASTTIQGRVNSLPNTVYRLEFFSNTAADPSGYGEGETFLGATNVTTDGAGNAGFTFIPASLLPVGRLVTATATDPAGNTSEFSLAAAVSQVISVFSAADSGPGSLRQALLDADARAGHDTIAFNIPGAGPHTISPLSSLPIITSPVTIDGYTQPGARPNTLAVGSDAVLKIELDGTLVADGDDVGLYLSGSSNSVRGLVINRFSAEGVYVDISSSYNTISGNFIGTDAAGINPLGNGDSGVSVYSPNNVIGGTNAAARNVISGNLGDGIGIIGVSCSNNVVAGNFIGTCAAGINPLGNGGNGVTVSSPNNVIGGNVPAARNLISGHISTNGGTGVLILGPAATENVVAGNYIGTDATGTNALPNSVGIYLDATTNAIVGGPSAASRNVIAANFFGIVIISGGGHVVQGNYIGTDASGGIGIGNNFGIYVKRSADNTLGGAVPGAGNVISGNVSYGVLMEENVTGTRIQGNLIGTDATATRALGNGTAGIAIVDVRDTLVGGTTAGAGNVISHNGQFGVTVPGTNTTNNAILGNSIFANGGLGIDLGGDGVTFNDLGDIDGSPNHLQNFPVLTAVFHAGSVSYIQGYLNSASNRTFRVEFFANDAADSSGHGEGQTFLTAFNMTTGIDGNAAFLAPFLSVPFGRFITATATDPDGNTSEFSLAIRVGDPNAPVIRVNGQVAVGPVTVTNSAVISMEGGFTNGHFFYTVDGSDPTFGLVYSAPFVVQQTAMLRAIAFDAGYDLEAEAEALIVNVVVQRAPQIVRQPQGLVLPVGGLAVFEMVADGTPPLAFQWRRNGTPLANETNAALVLTNLQPAQAGNFNVVITNAFGAVTSAVAVLAVVPLPGIDKQPENVTVPAGGRAVFSVVATGDGPFSYQWRKTGVNIPGATGDMLVIDPARLIDSGTYDVVVVNAAGAVTSDPAVLIVTTNAVVGGDFFAGRIPLGSVAAGFINGTNTGAMMEMGEPEHGGKRGSNSIWFKWTAPANGVVVVETSGSSFDTLLGVYTGSAVGALTTVARGEDNGDYLSSVARFSAASGVEYAIAVDGFAGGQGRFVLGWQFTPTNNPLPTITAQPPSFLTVTQGASVSLSVTASAGGDPLDYQWHFNLQPLPGATGPVLALVSAQPTDVGYYKLAITNRTTRQGIESEFFALEIGPNTNAHSVDKFEDLVALIGGGGGGQGGGLLAPAQIAPGGSLVIRAGDVDSHFLNNTVATTQLGEPNHCGLQVSRSVVMSVRSDVTATCFINTFGSAIATILAVYEADAFGNTRLDRPVGCGASGGPGAGATVQFAAAAGKYYTVFVDGLAGDRGLIRLNWAVSAQAVPSSIPTVFKVRRGSRATLSVGIENLAAYTYQWRHNGTNLPNAFTARLTLTNVQPSDAGDYGVALRGATASETRHVATLEVDTTTQVLAYSVFEDDAEGWLTVGNVRGPTRLPSGGNPDGCLSATATNVSTNAWFWIAPPKFLGNQFSAYEGVLEFDLRQATGSATLPHQPDVVLQSSGLSLSYTMGQAPSAGWTSFKVPLKETTPGWKVGEGLGAGPAPSQAQMLSVLRALTGIKIRGRFTAATNTLHLDTVALVGLCTNNTVVLNWEKLGGNRLHLEWPVSAVCLQLETATSLSPPDWQIPMEPPTVRNNTNIFELDMNEPRRFFRLRQP